MTETTRETTDYMAALQKAPETAMQVLGDPKAFYAAMPREGGYEAPGVFAAIMLVAEGSILALFALLHLHIGGAIAALIATPIFGAIGLAVGAAILLFASGALGGEATFESSFRIVAYASAIAPLQAVSSIIPYLPLLVSAYGIYLAIIAVIAVHRVPEQQAWRVIGGIGAVLLLFGLLGTMSARRVAPAADAWGRRMQQQADELQRKADDMKRELEQQKRRTAD